MVTSSTALEPPPEAGLGPTLTLLRWCWAGLWREQGVRAVLAVLAIAIGVALGLAVHLVNRSALGEFDQALARINGQADAQIVPAMRAFDEALYGRLIGPEGRMAGINSASPVIALTVHARRIDRADGARRAPAARPDALAAEAGDAARTTVALNLIGLDLFRAATVTPELLPSAGEPPREARAGQADAAATAAPAIAPRKDPVDGTDTGAGSSLGSANNGSGTGGSGSAVFGDDTVFLSPSARTRLGVQIGDPITVAVGLREQRLRVAGEVAAGQGGPPVAVMDLGALQWRFDWLGHLNRIDLRLADGIDATRLATSLQTLLADTALVQTPDASARRMSNLSRAYRVNLLVLSGVALFTGAFIVYATLALTVTRQQTSLALLGVLGGPRRLVDAVVLGQGLALGLVGSAMGVLAGIGIAWLLLSRVGADLGAGYFQAGGVSLQITALPILLGLLAGALTGWAGAWLPLRQLQQQPLLARLRGLAAEDRLRVGAHARRRILVLTLVWSAGGLVLQALPPVFGLPLPAYAAIACVLFAGIVAVPLVIGLYARALGALLAPLAPRPTGPLALALSLAVARLRGAPAAASGALSGIVVSFALACAMAIMVGSFRDSVDAWLARVLPADLYARGNTTGLHGPIEAGLPARLSRLPGIARVESQRVSEIDPGEGRGPITVIARRIDAAHPDRELPLTGLPRLDAGAAGDVPIYVSEAMVDLHGLQPGTVTTLPLGPPGTRFVVRAVWRDYARQSGAVAIDRADYARLTGDTHSNDLAVWLAPGTRPAEAQSLLIAAEPGLAAMGWRSTEDLRELSLGIFDRSFFITYLLEAITLGVGLFGVATGFAADAWSRSREFGMLRHLGLSRRELGTQLGLEAALLVGCALIWGGALGFGIAWILIERVNPQSFHWTMDMSVPGVLIASAAVTMVLLGAATAYLATRRASGQSPIAAVRADW